MILVVGATGMLGGAITQLLLARGERVRILIRPQSQERATPHIRARASRFWRPQSARITRRGV